MSFAPLLSCSDGSCVRVNPDFVVAVEPERRDPSVSPRPRACRISLVDGEQIDVPGAADEVQRALGLICIRLALFPSGTPVFLNPSLVLAVEDQSGGKPLVTRSLVLIITGGLNNSAGHDLAPALVVRETAQQIMAAILAADKRPRLGRTPDRSETLFAAPCEWATGPTVGGPRKGATDGRRFFASPMIRAKGKRMST
jgi:hypothetical protein